MASCPTVKSQITRGIIAACALVAAYFAYAHSQPLSYALIAVSLFAMRGCPACWTIGLVQTVWAKLRGRPAAGACLDGACARR